MSNFIVDDIKAQFKQGNVLTRLIIVNIAVLVIANVWEVLFFLFDLPKLRFLLFDNIAIPSSLSELIFKPWTFITYMFMHAGIWHLLMNMLILYFSGRIFLLFLNQRQLLGTYILGGFAGAILFVIAYNIFPVFQGITPMVGASASILAILTAAATISPDYSVNLMFVGRVKLKYIAAFYFVISLISISSGNAGGNIAHIGGALFGYFYIKRLHQGKDLTIGIMKLIDTFTFYLKPKPKMKVAYKKTASDEDYNKSKVDHQAQVDSILDKISKSGYDSLSKQEKEILFKASNKK